MNFIAKQCAHCQEPAGTWEQWENAADGYGVCPDCIDLLALTSTKAEILTACGVDGIHWGRGKRNPFVQSEHTPRADGFIGLTPHEAVHARDGVEQYQIGAGIRRGNR